MTIKIINGGALIITGEYHTPPTGIIGGPQTLSFKDWKKDENGYNFKLTTGDDILKRIDMFKDNILTLKDDINIGGRQYTINLLDEYWSNKEWKSNKSAFFENVLLELEALSNNSVINNRTLLYIPWNIHFIVIKELNYDIDLGHVTYEPDNNNFSTGKYKLNLSGKIRFGYRRPTDPPVQREPVWKKNPFFGIWADNQKDLDIFLKTKWAVRNLIRAYIYYTTELEITPNIYKLYADADEKLEWGISDDNLEYYENKMKLKEDDKQYQELINSTSDELELEEDIKTETPQLKTPLKYIEQPTEVIEPEPVITYPDRPQVSTKFWETLFEGVDDKKKKLKKIRQNIKKQNKKEIMRFLSMVNLDKYTDNFLDNEFYTVQEILDYPLIEEELDELGMTNKKEQVIYKYYIDEVNKLQN